MTDVMQRALDSQGCWVKNVSSFLLLRFKLWAFVKLWGTLLTSETEIVELSWAESFMCCDVDTWLNDKDAQRVVGFYCTGCVNSPCRRKRFDRGWRDDANVEAALGQFKLAWPESTSIIAYWSYISSEKGNEVMQMSGLPSGNPSCCSGQLALTCPAAQCTSIIASSGYKFKDGFCLGRWDDFGGTDKENNNKYESSHLVWIWNGKCTNCWSNLGLNSSLMIIDSLSKEDNWQFRVNCGVIAEWNVWVWYPIVRFPASLAFGRASGLTTKPAAFRCRLLVASLLSTSGSFGQ